MSFNGHSPAVRVFYVADRDAFKPGQDTSRLSGQPGNVNWTRRTTAINIALSAEMVYMLDLTLSGTYAEMRDFFDKSNLIVSGFGALVVQLMYTGEALAPAAPPPVGTEFRSLLETPLYVFTNIAYPIVTYGATEIQVQFKATSSMRFLSDIQGKREVIDFSKENVVDRLFALMQKVNFAGRAVSPAAQAELHKAWDGKRMTKLVSDRELLDVLIEEAGCVSVVYFDTNTGTHGLRIQATSESFALKPVAKLISWARWSYEAWELPMVDVSVDDQAWFTLGSLVNTRVTMIDPAAKGSVQQDYSSQNDGGPSSSGRAMTDGKLDDGQIVIALENMSLLLARKRKEKEEREARISIEAVEVGLASAESFANPRVDSAYKGQMKAAVVKTTLGLTVTTIGAPFLAPLDVVEVHGLGPRFDNMPYRVDRIEHALAAGSGWTTTLSLRALGDGRLQVDGREDVSAMTPGAGTGSTGSTQTAASGPLAGATPL